MTESLFHVQFGIVARSKGNDARKVSAYQMCARVPRRDGKPFDFRRKQAEHVAHEMLLPDGAPPWAADPARLWQQAEDAEKRGDAQVARLVEVSIPREVPADMRIDFVRSVIQPWVTGGMAAQIDTHCTRASDGAEQPHAHVLLTMRRFDGNDFAAKKEREWNRLFTEDNGRKMRGAVADRMNHWMAQHKISVRVDHRTHEEQGITGPAPEKNTPRRAWAAHRAASDSTAAEPVRKMLAERQQRADRRRDIEWQQAHAEYAAAAAAHYAAEHDRRSAAYAERRAAEQATRADLRARQRGERDRTYRHTRRGIVRNLSLAFQRGRHERDRTALDTQIQATRLTGTVPGTPFPAFDEWLDDRAAEGDKTAKAAMAQRQSRRESLAQKDPAAAARRNVDDVSRAADRVLSGRPRASVDDAALFAAARDKLTERRDHAAEAAQAAQAAANEHRHKAGFWRRQTDAGWQAEHARLTGTAQRAQQQANQIAARYDTDMKTAREAARLAAAENRRTLAAWLARPDVQAAHAAKTTAEHVRAALDSGDENTINAAARGDLPAAAHAARVAEARQQEETDYRREQERAAAAAARLAAAERARAEAERARTAGSRTPTRSGTAPTLAPSMKPR